MITPRAGTSIILCLQALLLLVNLDLLPVWSDELFTLKTVGRPVAEIVASVKNDIHPPLYYVLLHYWEQAPLPWRGVSALRAFSAFWALAAVWLLDRFWTRGWRPSHRWPALSLFAFSPCLLLYGRMARSYAMQTALFLLAASFLWRWVRRRDGNIRSWLPAFLAVVALLYTHYVPGLALLGWFCLLAWRPLGFQRVALFVTAVLAAYLPWLVILTEALRRWGQASGFASHYSLTGNPLTEHVLKIGFGLVSLTIGETFAPASLVLVPAALLLAWLGARSRAVPRPLAGLVVSSAVIGYLGVSRWVSYPFIPARLLWLLPFLCLAITLGIMGLRPPYRRLAAALFLLSYASSTVLYFRRENFLNLGYAAPLREIAGRINGAGTAADLVLIDSYNTDAPALVYYLSGRTPSLILAPETVQQARPRVASARSVWIVHNQRDISPDGLTTRLIDETCAGRQRRDALFQPYADWQRLAMRPLGLPRQLTHFYELTACTQAAFIP